MITRETISQSEQRWDPSAVGWITVSSLCFQGTDQPTMKSQCWGREAKPCLSERSGCCSLLKCQVLLKNNTPSSLSVSIPSSVSALPPPHQTPASAGAEVEEWTLGLVSPSQRGKLQRFFYLQKFCLYIYIYIFIYIILFFSPHISPVATEVETARVMKWTHFFSSLFSLPSCRHTSSLDSFHFIPCLSWLFPWCGARSYRPEISQAPSNPSAR